MGALAGLQILNHPIVNDSLLPLEGIGQIPSTIATRNPNSQSLTAKTNFESVQRSKLLRMKTPAIEQNGNTFGIHPSQRDAQSKVCPLLQLPMYFRCIYIPGLQPRWNRENSPV